MKITKTYHSAEALWPVWQGKRMYHESVMYLEDEVSARLFYKPTEIIAVLSYDYQTEYLRGVDWDVEGDCLIRLPGSRIPYYPLEKYYPKENKEGQSFACTVEGHPYLAFGEQDTFQKAQISVSYRHNGEWTGRIPENHHSDFARFFHKLEHGKEATVVFYGDSITTGCNSTGTYHQAPYTPCFPYMIACEIAKKYGYTVSVDADHNMETTNPPLSGDYVLHYVNTAVGGKESNWGLANAKERVSAYHPDLLVLAFGMNDGGKSAEQYISLTQKIVVAVRADVPDVDICLISTMLPHWRAAGFFGHQAEYESVLEEFASKSHAVAVAPMTSVHQSLLARKEYYAMTGNNINHCNDFLARVYAMTVLETLGIKSITDGDCL